MSRYVVGVALVGTLLTLTVAQNQRGGERKPVGPPPVFRLEVPETSLDVIAGAPTRDSVVLSIRSKSDSDASLVVYDAAGRVASSQSFKLELGKASEVPVTRLHADNTYDYTLTQGNHVVRGRFTTASSRGKSFSFAIQADSHLDGNTDLTVYERTLDNILADKPAFFVDLGDTFMVDKYANYHDAGKQYAAQRYWFSKIGAQMSVFLCLGNHDGETGWPGRGGESTASWAREQRQSNFPTVRPNRFYSGAPREGLWYAFDWGDATFIVLDPFVATLRKTRGDDDGWNWTLGKTQFDWFERTLQKSRSKFKFVFIHHLVGGFGGAEARGGVEAVDRFEWGNRAEFSTQRDGWAEPIHDLMVRYGVTALFHGHDHLYVRQVKDCITYLECPQPGQARENAIGSAQEYGYSTGTLLGSSGHIRVTVTAISAKIEYVKSRAGEGNRMVADSVEIPPRL